MGLGFRVQGLGCTHRLLGSSMLGLPYRILKIGAVKRERLRSLASKQSAKLQGLDSKAPPDVGFRTFRVLGFRG